MKHLAPRVAALAACMLALISPALFLGCASQPAAPEKPVSAKLDPGPAVGLDQFKLRLPLVLELENPGRGSLEIESVECSLTVDGEAAGTISRVEAGSVGAVASAAIPLDFPIDIRAIRDLEAGGATAVWRSEARVVLKRSRGERLILTAAADGSFPVVREPEFRITSIKIERDLLVTTNLELALEIDNPNAFPLSLSSFAYNFYGEGRAWVDGGSDDPVTVPPASSTMRILRFTMNFANSDRHLLDLVAALKAVRYRLRGEARIATGLDYLPVFVARFDQAGVCAVQR